MLGRVCAGLAVFVGVGSSVAVAGDNGARFHAVAAGDCAVAGPEAICLTTPLVSGSAATALDVLRDIYPDLDAKGTGTQFAGAEAVEAASDPDAGASVHRAIDLSAGDSADVAVIEAGKAAYAAVVSAGVVAVTQLKPAYRPLGRLQVATDPGGPTGGFRLLLAAPGSPVAVTLSSHFNSQERFESLHLVGVVGGKLVDLYDGPYLYSLGEASDDCDLLDHQETMAILEAQKKSHHGLADIGIIVDYATTCVDGKTKRQVEKRSFPLRLTYDGTRYDGDTAVLDDFNAKFSE